MGANGLEFVGVEKDSSVVVDGVAQALGEPNDVVGRDLGGGREPVGGDGGVRLQESGGGSGRGGSQGCDHGQLRMALQVAGEQLTGQVWLHVYRFRAEAVLPREGWPKASR